MNTPPGILAEVEGAGALEAGADVSGCPPPAALVGTGSDPPLPGF